jgi:hypothetical protein
MAFKKVVYFHFFSDIASLDCAMTSFSIRSIAPWCAFFQSQVMLLANQQYSRADARAGSRGCWHRGEIAG